MKSVNPYLNFQGNTEEAFKFYKSVFGGEFASIQRFKDVPGEAGSVPENEKDKIMHIALPIGKSNVLMGTDELESKGQKLTQGSNFHLVVNTESEDEANRIFNGLSSGGKVTLPIGKAFWGAYFGMLIDKFGIRWMINYDESRQ